MRWIQLEIYGLFAIARATINVVEDILAFLKSIRSCFAQITKQRKKSGRSAQITQDMIPQMPLRFLNERPRRVQLENLFGAHFFVPARAFGNESYACVW